MFDIREKILQLVESKPKHYSRMVKNDTEMSKWVEDNTLVDGVSYAETIYSAVYGVSGVCDVSGVMKRFKSFTEGYGFCGRASCCECAMQSVSGKVSLSKQGMTPEQIAESNKKREQTSLRRYGVTNNGQTDQAKKRHAEFYRDVTKVTESIEKQKTTCRDLHGDENYNNRQKSIDTCISVYGVANPQQVRHISLKTQQTKKERYEPYYLAKLNYDSFVKNSIENYGSTPLISTEEYIGVGNRPQMDFECIECGHVFSKRFDYGSPPICKVCYPSDVRYKSEGELQILEYCNSLGLDTISGDRSVINPYEIDVYIPSLNFGIEYCGLYWHSEKMGKKSWNYHFRKFDSARNAGIDLITVYSDEWQYRRNTVESLIMMKANVMQDRVYARNTAVDFVDRGEAHAFIEKYHIQGAPTRMPINYGLRDGNELVAVMSFIVIGGELQLIRFCSSRHVVGGAGKLLKACLREHTGMNVISFSNNRFSNGNLYRQLGFCEDGVVPPMQEYIIGHYSGRVHKLGIKPYIAGVEGNTEWERAQNAKIDRIWDCGKVKWKLETTGR